MTSEGWSQDLKPELPECRCGALSLCSMLLIHCISVIVVWLGYHVCKKEAASRQECKFKGKEEMLGGGALGNLDSFHSFAWGCLNYSGVWAKFFNDNSIPGKHSVLPKIHAMDAESKVQRANALYRFI